MKAGPVTRAPQWVTEVEAAAAIGVTRGALSHWRRVLKLPSPACWQRAGNGRLMYDAAACARWREANLEPERSGRVAKQASGRTVPRDRQVAQRPAPEASEAPTPAPTPAVAGHVAAKAETERIRAKLLEIELGQKQSRLLDASEVEAAWSSGLTRVRRAAMAVPARVISELAGTHGLTIEQERAIIDRLVKDLDAAIAGASS